MALGQRFVGRQLPGGYSIQSNPNLMVPLYLSNTQESREIITREAMFSFPLAYAGFFAAGPVGVVVGHIFGAALGYVRGQRISS